MSGGGIGYVLKVFPRTSETFVVNEALALESFGERLTIFSLHHPAGAVRHATLGELQAPAFYMDDAVVEDPRVGRARRRLTELLGVDAAMRDRLLPRKYVRLAVALSDAARERGIEHLHAHFASRSGHVTVLAAALLGVPCSITAHAKDIYHREVDVEALRWKIRHAKFVVTVTDYNVEYLRSLFPKGDPAAAKMTRIYNGVDLRRFRPVPIAGDGVPLLLGVGRLVEKKGFAVLVQACRELREAGRVFRCEIVGSGDQEQPLREHISALSLGDIVTLAGALPTEQVAERMRCAFALVAPCVVGEDGNVDALPTVVIEAMASARPVVATHLSGLPEMVVQGETGLLVAPGRPAELAAALGELLDAPSRARAMGEAGRRRAELLFDLFSNAARVRALIRQTPAAQASA